MIRFAKAHGYGNDFLYVRQADAEGARLDLLARQMCDRHTGVGADGLIVYRASGEGASMRLFNADGSRAEVSGNGVRALGALLARENPELHVHLTVDTEGGTKRLERMAREGIRQTFRASMGLPVGLRRETLVVGEERVDGIILNIGNPQFLILGPLPDDARFARLGAALEHHPAFPDGTNVEFVQVEAPARLRIRIWERGVGPTQSSGTGSCASLIAAAAFGGGERTAEVIAPGGAQRVEWREDNVYLTGWAEVLCEGDWYVQLPR